MTNTENNYTSIGIGRKFKTMAEGRNFIEKTNIYTSKMKPQKDKKYYGRGKGDLGNGGFLDSDGIWNQFITLGKNDVGYKNEYFPNIKNGIWIEKCISEDKEKLNDWVNKRGNDIKNIRLFIKDQDGFYECIGVFKYSFTAKEKYSVIWNRI
jgi:hypothetical protein